MWCGRVLQSKLRLTMRDLPEDLTKHIFCTGGTNNCLFGELGVAQSLLGPSFLDLI